MGHLSFLNVHAATKVLMDGLIKLIVFTFYFIIIFKKLKCS